MNLHMANTVVLITSSSRDLPFLQSVRQQYYRRQGSNHKQRPSNNNNNNNNKIKFQTTTSALGKLRALTLDEARRQWAALSQRNISTQERDDPVLFEGLSKELLSSPSYLSSSSSSSLDYAQTFHSFNRSLSFLHIPKTGGSTVENSHTQQGWGKCIFIGDTLPANISKLNLCPWQKHPHHPLQLYYHDIPDWHLPSHVFPLLKAANPYSHSDLFVVIRPPLERIVSQYYWYCIEVHRGVVSSKQRYRYCPPAAAADSSKREAAMIRYIRERLLAKSSRRNLIDFYVQEHGHWIPQYDFIVGPLQTRYVDHVLQLSNMSVEYPRLGQAYDPQQQKQQGWTWPRERANAQGFHKKKPSSNNIANMEAAMQKLMKHYYRHDFELLFR